MESNQQRLPLSYSIVGVELLIDTVKKLDPQECAGLPSKAEAQTESMKKLRKKIPSERRKWW